MAMQPWFNNNMVFAANLLPKIENPEYGYGFIGDENNYWSDCYIHNLHGTADNAYADSFDNQIHTFYGHSLSVNGTNLSLLDAGGNILNTVEVSAVDNTKLPLAGGTVTGIVNMVGNASNDASNSILQISNNAETESMISLSRTDTEREIRIGVGSSGTNAGIYDKNAGRWMIYSTKDDANVVRIPTTLSVEGSIAVGGNKDLYLDSTSDNNAAEITWRYANGNRMAQITTGTGYTAKSGLGFTEWKSDGTSLYSGTIPLGDGTGASGTWGISVTGNSANVTGVVAVANGGTGKTTGVDACNYLLNSLSTGSSNPTGADYYIAQYAGGGTTTTTYHRRPVSALYNYIKSAASGSWAISVTGSSASCTGNAASSTIARALGADDSMKVYGQSSNEVNFGGTNNSSTIYMGYRAKDSKPIPTQFIFGGSTGTASVKAGSYIAGNHSSAIGTVKQQREVGSLTNGSSKGAGVSLEAGTWLLISSCVHTATSDWFLILVGAGQECSWDSYHTFGNYQTSAKCYQACNIVQPSSTATYYTWAYGDSSTSGHNCIYHTKAIRIA